MEYLYQIMFATFFMLALFLALIFDKSKENQKGDFYENKINGRSDERHDLTE